MSCNFEILNNIQQHFYLTELGLIWEMGKWCFCKKTTTTKKAKLRQMFNLTPVNSWDLLLHHSYSCRWWDRMKTVFQRHSACATEVKFCVWTYFLIGRWKSVMQSQINSSMIWNIELLWEYKSHGALCLATSRSDTALLFLHRNVNSSPDLFISAHFRWLVGPRSALPSHPLSSSPLGPIRALELKINETWWQNSIYFKTSCLIWRSLSDLRLN